MTHNLLDRLRPKDFSEVVGQDAAIQTIRNRVQSNRGQWAGIRWLITGPSGTGKTTLAKIIASKTADDWNSELIHADQVGAEWLDSVEERIKAKPWLGKLPGYAFVIDESHCLRAKAVGRLNVMMERTPWTTFIFTTTLKGLAKLFEDDVEESPFKSRCTEVRLSVGPDTMKAFAERAKQIALELNMNGQPDARYQLLIARYKGNFRNVIEAIASGEMKGE